MIIPIISSKTTSTIITINAITTTIIPIMTTITTGTIVVYDTFYPLSVLLLRLLCDDHSYYCGLRLCVVGQGTRKLGGGRAEGNI